MKKTEAFWYFIIFLAPFLFYSCGGGKTKGRATSEDKKIIDKIVDCKYVSEVEILGNADCTKMFCHVLNTECNLKDGEKGTYPVVCLAVKKPDGSYSCPKAYDCAISETPEYDEYKDNLPKGVIVKNTFFNDKCDGVITWRQGGVEL